MKGIYKIIALVLSIGLIIGLTAACGSKADVQNTTNSENTNNKSSKETVKIAYLPITHALPIFVENQLQNRTGDNFKIELVKYGSWPELMDALNTGRVDGASVLIELAMKAKEQGIGIKAVALGHKDGNVIVVANDINSVADLKGKNFAIPHRQSSHNILLGQLLKDAGLTYKDLKVVELSPPEMPAALAQGQIAGYCVAEPFGAKSVAINTGKVLADSKELWEDSICCSLVLTESFINDKHDIAQKLTKQYNEAGKYIEEHKKETEEIAKQYLKLDDNVYNLSMKWISFDDLRITKGAYTDLTKRLIEFDISKTPPTYDDFIDDSLFG
ncbi:ABC transporter substrate-binding protein [Ruminiclostridium herbifermentans]|uniref:ABC transporter substrate-binding protein n=1 Tax=Ruminiclostridium herbifermentans TaxID=2488810 RepID=A0A4V6YE35_9FIRM|nr:ABC transporter substrate-binding protein [Ruminiclostridium herbifermentans]QNU68099.1 ABC transporter substrate-binding protein [Ruminiclostridium herbifermentans]